jgi:hypothetical protein
MIDQTEAQRFLARFPWPAEVKTPHVELHAGREGEEFHCFLSHHALPHVVAITGPTPEGALRHAVLRWCGQVARSPMMPEHIAAIRSLRN